MEKNLTKRHKKKPIPGKSSQRVWLLTLYSLPYKDDKILTDGNKIQSVWRAKRRSATSLLYHKNKATYRPGSRWISTLYPARQYSPRKSRGRPVRHLRHNSHPSKKEPNSLRGQPELLSSSSRLASTLLIALMC